MSQHELVAFGEVDPASLQQIERCLDASGVHFGSRGLGHQTASGFLSLASGRNWVVDRILRILQTQALQRVQD